MKVALIGASGFVGRRLSALLQRNGAETILFDLRPDEGSGVMPLDIRSGIQSLPKGIAATIYLAQSPEYKKGILGASDVLAVNSIGCIRACEASVKSGARLFLNASSGSVYAPSFEPLSENSPLNWGGGPYAASKLAAEDALESLSQNIGVCSMRIFSPFGPGQSGTLPATLFERVRKRLPIILHTKGEGKDGGLEVSFIYVDDLCECIAGLLDAGLKGVGLPHTINLAGERSVSIEEFCTELCGILGAEPLFEVSETPREFDLAADVSLLKAVVNPSFAPLKEALAKSV